MGLEFVVFIIIGINALVSFKGFNDMAFFRKYEFHVGSIRAGDQVRMFTSAFLHADLQHLIFNMITLYFFGPTVVYYLGTLGFVMVYLISLVAGNLLTLYFHKNDYSYRAIGASGAVMGIVFSSILLNPHATINYFIPAYLFGIFYLLYSIYGMRAKNDNIGHTAHFGGAIGGYAVTLARMPELFYTETIYVIILAVPIIILFIMAKMGKL
ncbi:rhomboid family intramembrane serine protease [Flavobacterium psychrotrophum]|uniref:rhomboid family intramembrane serine protease n=1 Tax=Flavobacterium psychrotrophum TaxID=2294119 RepID=UPI000E31EF58|nr:rhomboid family intramembrane serine protease [Flavobacterium psychrotrophum]